MPTEYERLGVDAQKKGVHRVFGTLNDNLYPNAFCVVTRDPDFLEYGAVHHTDSAGSKPIQNYIHYKETGDIDYFKSLAQDTIAMNVNDIICVGAKPLSFIDYIAINSFKVPKEELLQVLKNGFTENFNMLKNYGSEIQFAGGETADLPDQLRTLDVSGALMGRVKLSEVITGQNINDNCMIIGLRSGGKTKYESTENSGIMCNGITLARHCLMHKDYENIYPEIKGERGYSGKFKTDQYVETLNMTVGEAIMSGTRIYAPVILKILSKYGSYVKGLVHNTGGGQTKSLKLGQNIHYIKNQIFPPDPIFHLIQTESKESWKAMFEDYNMGTGFEIIIDREVVDETLSIPDSYGLEAKIIGRCKQNKHGNQVTIQTKLAPTGAFDYKSY